MPEIAWGHTVKSTIQSAIRIDHRLKTQQCNGTLACALSNVAGMLICEPTVRRQYWWRERCVHRRSSSQHIKPTSMLQQHHIELDSNVC